MAFALQPLQPGFTPAYVQISDQIRAAITSGQLAPGDALPSQEDMAASLGVARMTVNQALGILKTEGLLASQRGKATTVLSAGAHPVPTDEVVTAYLNSQIPGSLRVYNASLDELQRALLPALPGLPIFIPNKTRPLQLLLPHGADAGRFGFLLDSSMDCFEIHTLPQPDPDAIPAFIHMDHGETFMRLGRAGSLIDPAKRLHFTINRSEGDPVQDWFDKAWAAAEPYVFDPFSYRPTPPDDVLAGG